MAHQTYDSLKLIRNDFAVPRLVAQHRGDDDDVRRIDEGERETLKLLSQPAIHVFHGVRASEVFAIEGKRTQ